MDNSIETKALAQCEKIESVLEEITCRGLKITNQSQLSRQIKPFLSEDCIIEAMTPCKNNGKTVENGDTAISCRIKLSGKEVEITNLFYLYGYELKAGGILITGYETRYSGLKKEDSQAYPSHITELMKNADGCDYLCIVEQKTAELDDIEKKTLGTLLFYLTETELHLNGFSEEMPYIETDVLRESIKVVEKCYRKNNPYLLGTVPNDFKSRKKENYMDEIKSLYEKIVNDVNLSEDEREKKTERFLETVSEMLPVEDRKKIFTMLNTEHLTKL